MRTFYLSGTRCLQILVGCALLWFAAGGTSPAQTLARPGWVGSGLSAEPWWRNAVFYRVTPLNFQDSDGDGNGDLRGVAQRLEYMQTLGVDALVLEAPFDDTGLDELLEEAGRHHIRLLVSVSSSEGPTLLPRARQWLTRGAAGVWFRPMPGEQAAELATEVRALRSLADSFPGERVVIEDTTRDPALVPAAGAQLTVRALQIGTLGEGDDVSLLRTQISEAQSVPQGSAPLLLLREEIPSNGAGSVDDLRKFAAATLFASRAAIALEYGQEIGLSGAKEGKRRLMQWTPANVTRPAATVSYAKTAPTPTSREDLYGAFVPYVPPEVLKPAAKSGPDLDALPGFTAGKLPEDRAESSAVEGNVAGEESDPDSVLNFYRRLAQLHHGKAAMREGAAVSLNHASEGVLLLVRRPPVGDRAATPVVLACNLTGKRLTVSLAADFGKLKVRGGYLRVLLASPAKEARVPQSTDSLVLAPWGAVIAELEYE